MDDRILHDPHLEVMPDHAGPHYDALRATLTQNGLNAEDAVLALNDSWTLGHVARVEAWELQVAADAAAALALAQQQQQQPEQLDLPQVAPVHEEADAEKKKPKMNDFDDTTTVGNYIAPRPAQYALRRVEDFLYAELWYFTPDGCSDATQQQLTQYDDAFGLTKVDDMVALKSVSSLKASKNVILDADLSFRQMSMAKNALIPLMAKYQWPEKAINAFAQLFTQLELHPFRLHEFGERALITYQARVRREWHDQLKLGSAFNVGLINEDLLQSIYKELLDKAQLLSLKEVSPSLFVTLLSLLINPLSFFLPSLFPAMHLVSCCLQLVPCTSHRAPFTAYHAPLHHAPCTLHHAPCITHLAPRYTLLRQLSCGWHRAPCPCRRVVRTLSTPPGGATIETGMLPLAGMPVGVVASTITLVLVPPCVGLLNVPLPHPTTAFPTSSRPPPNLRLFHPAQPFKAFRSVPSAWPQTPTTPGSVVLRPFGMDPKPGAERMTREGSSPQQAPRFAATGTTAGAAPPAPMSSVMSALDAETRIMGLRGALERRRSRALTPYKVEAWESMLHHCNLLDKYPKLVSSLHKGFDAGIWPIFLTSTPPNSASLLQHPIAYQEMVTNEFTKGRYVGPCTRSEVERLIGPFQSSPLLWVPKPGKPDKYRAVHNFLYPRNSTSATVSINSSIDADLFPCTWGTFATVCFTIFNLPPGSQAAIRDVAEAYRTIPIVPDQWPGLVVKLCGDDEYAINTCNNFGLTSAGGIYGEVGDATLDIFRAQGIGPISRWVDDHIFFRILSKSFSFSLAPLLA